MTTINLVPEPEKQTVLMWRCAWIDHTGFRPFEMIKPKPQREDYKTKDAAMERKRNLQSLGREIVATVMPVHIMVRRSLKKARRMSLDAAGWPIQMAPPK